jgi:hypothetical protein
MNRTRTNVWRSFWIWSGFVIALTLASGIQHDYRAYLRQWLLVTSDNPWSIGNAYGPVHNLFALLLPIGRLAPKLFFGLALVLTFALLLKALVDARGMDKHALNLFVLAITANVLTISVGFIYGLNDGMVAALVILAILTRHRRRFIVSGVLLGVAGALKFYPLALVPFFMIDGDRLRIRLALAAAACFGGIMGIAVLLWGDAVFAPLLFAAERGPKILSVLRALQAHPGLAGGPEIVQFLIRYNSVIVVLVWVGAFILLWQRGANWLEASAVGLLAVLTAYKVGNQQFYLSWIVIVAALPLLDSQTSDKVGKTAVPMLIFLSLVQLWYLVLEFQSPRDYVGFAAIGFALWTAGRALHVVGPSRRRLPQLVL